MRKQPRAVNKQLMLTVRQFSVAKNCQGNVPRHSLNTVKNHRLSRSLTGAALVLVLSPQVWVWKRPVRGMGCRLPHHHRGRLPLLPLFQRRPEQSAALPTIALCRPAGEGLRLAAACHACRFWVYFDEVLSALYPFAMCREMYPPASLK